MERLSTDLSFSKVGIGIARSGAAEGAGEDVVEMIDTHVQQTYILLFLGLVRGKVIF